MCAILPVELCDLGAHLALIVGTCMWKANLFDYILEIKHIFVIISSLIREDRIEIYFSLTCTEECAGHGRMCPPNLQIS